LELHNKNGYQSKKKSLRYLYPALAKFRFIDNFNKDYLRGQY